MSDLADKIRAHVQGADAAQALSAVADTEERQAGNSSVLLGEWTRILRAASMWPSPPPDDAAVG